MEDFNIKEFNKSVREQIAKKALETNPYLVIVQVGDNPASNIYVRNKIKACEECNIKVKLDKYPEDIEEQKLINIVASYSYGINDITGVIVQMPLPKHISEAKICEAINPAKDVDGFHPTNVGRHAIGEKTFVPATVKGVSSLITNLVADGIIGQTAGKNCVIIGRSNIVGKPMAIEMINKFSCTTIVCNSRTPLEELRELCWNADIIICAIGKPNFIDKKFFVNQESEITDRHPVVIDVGINRLDNGKITGDCDYEGIKDYCTYITPVPGGVGPLTITGLLHNTAYYKDYNTKED